MAWDKQDAGRLAEIRNEMIDLAMEAKDLIRVNGTKFDFERAKAYYLGHILAALDNGEYMERETLKAYLEDIGYDTDTNTFEDEPEEESEDFDPDDDSNLKDEDRE